MAKITTVDDFFGRGAVDWLEFRYGQRMPIGMQLVEDLAGVDTPVNLSTLTTLEVKAEEILVDVATVAPSRALPDGGVTLSNPQVYDPARQSTIAHAVTDEASGRFSFITPDIQGPNPSFDAATLPALVIWVRYEVAATGAEDVAPLGIFYRRGIM